MTIHRSCDAIEDVRLLAAGVVHKIEALRSSTRRMKRTANPPAHSQIIRAWNRSRRARMLSALTLLHTEDSHLGRVRWSSALLQSSGHVYIQPALSWGAFLGHVPPAMAQKY